MRLDKPTDAHAAPAALSGIGPSATAQEAGLASLVEVAVATAATAQLPVAARPSRGTPGRRTTRPAPNGGPWPRSFLRAALAAREAATGQQHATASPAPVGSAPPSQQAGGRHRQLARRAASDAELAAVSMQIRQLSAGKVKKITSSGPVLAPRPGRRRLRKSTFAPILGRFDRLLVAVLTIGWTICVTAFWAWWLEPSHRVGVMGLVLNSAVLFYVSCYPVFFVVGINRLRNVSRSLAVPLLRVAFVVTRAPSEPWQVASSTLFAMLDQDFPVPYDVWLCDEQPTPEIVGWCDRNDVMLATRNGVQAYHRDVWPRRTRCKEGNLAYFYDNWGYRWYDVVAQLDCDHRPARTYLAEVVRPFSDPAVGYVAAPSVCDANARTSWSARGRLYREATFHGAFQLGHSDGWGPLCIGSHYAVRTQALREVGGIGPELAEDFSTSYLLNSAGWHGAFAINAEAHGDGPNTFPAMLVQEFQWSRSLTTVLLGLVPRNLSRLQLRLRFRFLYALSYYILLVSTTLAGIALAPVAAVTGRPWINVNYVEFLLHWWSISVWLVLMAFLLRRRGLLRPRSAPIFSWENWLYTLARWPYIAWGIGSAMLQRLWPRKVTFKVTPKGSGGLQVFPLRLIAPYIVISIGSSCAAMFGETRNETAGYAFLSILTGAVYAIVSVAIPVLHAHEAASGSLVTHKIALWRTSRAALFVAALTFIPVTLAIVRYPAAALDYFAVLPSHLSPSHWLDSTHWQAAWKWLLSLKRRF
jgi:cellulose synthase/poly-beta-1,6-N-acetylglucosamine synthase-like glycosyltransferase